MKIIIAFKVIAIGLVAALLLDAPSFQVAHGQISNSVIITEFMASNGSTLLDEDGDASDWIELYNAGSAPVNLSGYRLTDDSAALDKWIFPAATLSNGDYLIVFASDKNRDTSGNQLHTNFKLSSSGEYLALVDNNGTVISEYEPSYPEQYGDVSFGLASDGSVEYYESPTPGAPNGNGVFPYSPVTADRPSSSLARGFYSSPQAVTLSADGAASIRYTTDGSTPTPATGAEYTGPISIFGTVVLRAVSIANNGEVSKTATFTYIFLDDVINQAAPAGWPTGFVNDQVLDYEMDPEIVTGQQTAIKDALSSIPSLSIVTDLDNLFDPGSGIYVNAQKRGSDWERPSSLELLNPDNSPAFQINSGLRIRGGFSRRGDNPKHSFRFYFRSEYDGTLDYPLFEDEGVDSFKRLGLRTEQNNSWSFAGDGQNTFLREIWQRDTERDMGNPYTRSRYVHLYINGQYWGIYMTQENARDEYAESYFGGDKDEYDVVKGGGSNQKYEVSAGDSAGWDALWPLIQDQVVTDAEHDQIAAAVDLDSLIDNVIIRLHAGDFDGIISGYADNLRSNNWIAIRNGAGNGVKWTFLVHDGEASMGVANAANGRPDVEIDRVGPHPTLNGNPFYLPEYFNPMWLHQALATNTQYQQRFQYRASLHLNQLGGALTEGESLARWNTRKAQVEPALLAESARWGDAQREEPYVVSRWQTEVNEVENVWFPQRNNIFFNQLLARNLAADPPPGPPAPPSSPEPKIILNEYNAVDSEEFLKNDGSDTVFGRVLGNGGDWFEVVTIADNLDIRGWQLELWDGDTFAEVSYRTDVFVFNNDSLLSNLQKGTILTIAEDVADDSSYDPASGDWWINFQANSDDDGAYFTAASQSNFDTNNTNWQLIIRDANGNLVSGPAGEGIGQIASGVSGKEVAKLEEDPSREIRPESQYNDGATSTFGAPNQWAGGSSVQDFAALRGTQPSNNVGDVDCDNDLDAVDALFALQYTVALRTDNGGCPLADRATQLHAAAGDIDGNGRTDAVDALFILQCSVGINNGFCPEVQLQAAMLMGAEESAAAAEARRLLTEAGLWQEQNINVFIPLISR